VKTYANIIEALKGYLLESECSDKIHNSTWYFTVQMS